MKQPIKYALILFLITGICVGILGAVNQITSPIITENAKKAEEAAMKNLLSESESFEEASGIEDAMVQAVFIGKKGEETVGYVVKVAPTGYGGTINMLVAMDTSHTIKGISILSHGETPGFGANATKDSFKKQYEEKQAPLAVTKSQPGENEIEAITGATITSTAVTDAVNAASSYIVEHEGEWGN